MKGIQAALRPRLRECGVKYKLIPEVRPVFINSIDWNTHIKNPPDYLLKVRRTRHAKASIRTQKVHGFVLYEVGRCNLRSGFYIIKIYARLIQQSPEHSLVFKNLTSTIAEGSAI